MKTCWATGRWASILLVAGVLLGCAQAAWAWSYHSFSYGYSISLPDDWVQVPEEILAADYTKLPTVGDSRARMDVAFQPKRGKKLDYPFILVQVQQYSQLGYPQQVNDREIHQIVKATTGLNPANPLSAETQVMEGGAEVDPLDGILNYDPESRKYIWSSTGNSGAAELVRTHQWGFFGKDVLVQVTLYERGKGSDRLRDMARAVAGSLKFEIGREYQPVFTFGDAVKMAGQMVAAPNLGVVVTFSCVGVAMLFAIVALATNRQPQPAREQYSVFERHR